MQEYPKALYKGHKNNHEHVIAKNAEHEQELRDAGHVDHAELPDSPDYDAVFVGGSGSAKNGGSVAEQNKELQEKLTETEQAFEAFQNDVSAMKARIAELEPEPVNANPTRKADDYSTWTADQLREEITNQGKEFKARDSKAELIAILEA